MQEFTATDQRNAREKLRNSRSNRIPQYIARCWGCSLPVYWFQAHTSVSFVTVTTARHDNCSALWPEGPREDAAWKDKDAEYTRLAGESHAALSARFWKSTTVQEQIDKVTDGCDY